MSLSSLFQLEHGEEFVLHALRALLLAVGCMVSLDLLAVVVPRLSEVCIWS